MILKDLSFALRNLHRNKLLAAINVVGLSIGIRCLPGNIPHRQL